MDAVATRAAKDQTVRVFNAPASSAGDITPAATAPDDGDQTFTNVSLSITKARRVPIRWNGEQSLSAGPGAAAMRAAQIQQAIRTLANEIESDLAGLHIYASRAAGTAATTPFGTANDYTGASLARKILADNGSPMSDLNLVIDTTAGANLRGKQSSVEAAGTDSILRQGVLLDINGMAVRESGQIKTNTAGAVTATVDATGYAVGSTTLTLSAAACTLVVGDVITFAGDTNQYVVAGGTLTSAGTLIIGAPGLRKAMSAATKAITVVAAAVRNIAFSKSAIVLAQRLPALPDGGDMAVDRTTITDPRSGLSFEVAMYPQYRQMQYEISCAWGVKVIKPEHVALLLG